MYKTIFNFHDCSDKLINETVQNIKHRLQKVYDEVVQLNEKRTFNNTVQPIINVYDIIEPLMNSIEYVENFHTDEKMREHSTNVNIILKQFLIKCSMRKDIYNAFKDYEKDGYKNEKQYLDNENNRYFEHSMRDFRRDGLHLNDSEVKDLKTELVKMETLFNKNINDETTTFMFTKSELDGLPETWFSSHDEVNGVYKVTLKYPDYIPIMKYCNIRNVRKKIYKAFNSRCLDKNIPLLAEIIKTRSILSTKLGYETYADYSTEVKAVKTAKTAIDFENRLNKMFTPLYEKERNELLVFAKNAGFSGEKIRQWDTGYYSRLYKEELYDMNMEEIRSYFPLKQVTKGMFEIYEKILDLKFSKIENKNVWENSVEFYEVKDVGSNNVMGYFYLDMYPRDGKYAHAAVFPLTYGFDTTDNDYYKGNYNYPIACMACNFPKGEPLNHGDVETYFHEFGHVMHIMCSKTKLSALSSFNVETDFVEAPSQMLEYWCYSSNALKLMSLKNGEHIPDVLIEKLKDSKKFMQGHHNKRQLLFGLLDLYYHSLKLDKKSSIDVMGIYHKLEEDILKQDPIKDISMVSSFGHLTGGYQAGYYGYLYSETCAANMYYKMFKGKELDKKTGMLYRTKILQQGATKDSVELIRDFLGEDVDERYFLMDKGLVI
jgi:thimet oligopeptidase